MQFFTGEFESARESLDRAVKLAPETKHHPLDPNTAVDARCISAWTLELVGASDQALAMIRKAVSVAERYQSAFDLTYATFFGAVLYSMRREWKVAEDWSRRIAAMAEEHGLPYFQLMGMYQHGVAMAAHGQVEAGMPLMRRAVAACQAIGVGLTGMYLRIAEASLLAKDIGSGLDAVEQALKRVKQKDEHVWEAELYRVRGMLLLEQARGRKMKGGNLSENEAEMCFMAAHKLAGIQGARKWSLRAALTLGNFWKERKKKKDARELVIQARRVFTEGLDTSDLHDADSLLAELS